MDKIIVVGYLNRLYGVSSTHMSRLADILVFISEQSQTEEMVDYLDSEYIHSIGIEPTGRLKALFFNFDSRSLNDQDVIIDFFARSPARMEDHASVLLRLKNMIRKSTAEPNTSNLTERKSEVLKKEVKEKFDQASPLSSDEIKQLKQQKDSIRAAVGIIEFIQKRGGLSTTEIVELNIRHDMLQDMNATLSKATKAVSEKLKQIYDDFRNNF